MERNEGFEKNPISMLDNAMGFDIKESYMYPTSFASGNTATMLCFDNNFKDQRYGVNGSDSPSASSSSSVNFNKMLVFFYTLQRKRAKAAGAEQEKQRTKTESNKTSNKKAKTTNPPSTKPVKVRKEKLGERIAALQQLVSPFGKTDTASVLHEAMGYIRFLHDQVQVLSSPYLQCSLSSNLIDGRGEEKERRHDLRSRGLCLVPIECTANVANNNGADFWSPANMGRNVSMP
ncbi:hypothetical protein IFM89_029211 [Coptis chinensis]|uniref:BHLH domain-containing protein n=1 Tax=Coptis chinensis TaxID=261450 RepID=A0A835IPY9_9MAGN|nr:hypothetical protein IFM89_029211 [Coptis chinensis]